MISFCCDATSAFSAIASLFSVAAAASRLFCLFPVERLRVYSFSLVMASPIPPPLFLSTPGDPPIPWADWKLIFEAYVDAIGNDARKPERRKALLLNALGYAGLKLYHTLSSVNASETPASSDVFQSALALFDDHFKDASCDYVARLRFQERRQLPGEPVVDFIASLRSLAASCGFGARENDMIRQQLFIGVASQNVRCRLLQKGSSISLSEALSIAREDELVPTFCCGGAMAPVLCFTGRANMAALLLRLGAVVNMAARLHSPFVAVNMAAPPLRGVEEAVKMAAQILLFKGNRALLFFEIQNNSSGTKWDDACYTVFGSNAISFVDCVDHSCFTVFQSHGFCTVHRVTAFGFNDIIFVDAGSTCECVCFASGGVPCACACASVPFRCASAGRACGCAGARASVQFADASASQGCPTGTSTSACGTLPSPGGEELPSACDRGAESPPSTHQRRRTKRKRRKPRRYEDYVQ
ncbi:hypothetical protein HPB52_013499 [Rhipicephalus sanguineus]|uniref:Tick transposon n=1 Tax=Rhipicephalus sanguineus TaxID=34632 RepID=A0A9D4SYY7_RHISA|nr:hypothetical protein HPB52_013499 [Rhipicephalus sanguineus]